MTRRTDCTRLELAAARHGLVARSRAEGADAHVAGGDGYHSLQPVQRQHLHQNATKDHAVQKTANNSSSSNNTAKDETPRIQICHSRQGRCEQEITVGDAATALLGLVPFGTVVALRHGTRTTRSGVGDGRFVGKWTAGRTIVLCSRCTGTAEFKEFNGAGGAKIQNPPQSTTN
jgi:hypothetical protein